MSSPKELMQLLQKEYKDRLRPRPYKSYLKDHMKTINEVTKLKLSKAWTTKSPAFSMKELTEPVKNLNRGKAGGLCSELIQSNVMGVRLKESLLVMLNNLKEEGINPNFMKESTVTTIPKTGKKFEPRYKRGIFKVSVLRSILLPLIYNRKYEMIDSNMSDNNIGAQRNKSCRNHIWLINGINHEQNSSKKNAQLVMQSFDFTQMFDSMSLSITISDM